MLQAKFKLDRADPGKWFVGYPERELHFTSKSRSVALSDDEQNLFKKL